MTVKTTKLHESGPEISKIVYGVWRINKGREILPAQQLLRRLELCVELGVSTFDHADIYGDYSCERSFGEAMKLRPALRGKIQVITKCGIMLKSAQRPDNVIKHYNTSAAHIEGSVDNSLKNLQCEYLDLLLIHRPDPFMDPEDTARGLENVVRSGKVRHIGVSNFAPWQMDLLQAYLSPRLVTNQIELHPLRQSPFVDGTLGHCQKNRIKPMAWSPLGGGRIFDVANKQTESLHMALRDLCEELSCTPGQLCLAWLMEHPSEIIPVIGTCQNERIQELAKAAELRLSRHQWFKLWTAAFGEVP